MILKLQAAVSIFTCTCFLSASTLPASIGVAVANGEVQVDGSQIRGNSTLFDGSKIQTNAVRSDLKFSDGSDAVLNPTSTMTVFRAHSVLEKGVALQRTLDKHPVIVDGMRISSQTKNASVLVGVKDSSHFEVLVQQGNAEVRSASGNLIAKLEAGKPLSFGVGDGGSSASSVRIHGIIRQDEGAHFLLTDSQTGVTYALQGSGLAGLVGASTEVVGTVTAPATNGAPETVMVASASNMGAGDGGGGQAQGGASPTATTTWTPGSIIFTVVVAVGGTLLGLAAAGVIGGGNSKPPVSTP